MQPVYLCTSELAVPSRMLTTRKYVYYKPAARHAAAAFSLSHIFLPLWLFRGHNNDKVRARACSRPRFIFPRRSRIGSLFSRSYICGAREEPRKNAPANSLLHTSCTTSPNNLFSLQTRPAARVFSLMRASFVVKKHSERNLIYLPRWTSSMYLDSNKN